MSGRREGEPPITLQISFQLRSSLGKGQECPSCKLPLRLEYIQHKFGWGDDKRLEFLVANTPVVRCGCGIFMPPEVALPIEERATAIANCFEFGAKEDFNQVAKILAPDAVSKVRDFAESLRNEPGFIPDGAFHQHH